MRRRAMSTRLGVPVAAEAIPVAAEARAGALAPLGNGLGDSTLAEWELGDRLLIGTSTGGGGWTTALDPEPLDLEMLEPEMLGSEICGGRLEEPTCIAECLDDESYCGV